MKYPFVPISARKPLRWPNGKRLAVMITTNLEYWDATKDTPKPFYPGGPGIVGGDLPGNVYDNPNYTWREYGQRVGVWRMFDIFDKFGVPSTCTMNAKMGLERRAVVDAALKRGWEIVAHNYVQTELLADYSFDEAKEREVIRETLRVYKEVCGKPAKGWLSSSLRCTLNTIDIIAEEGLIFTTDLLNDDQPYLVETRSGKKIVSIPYTSEVNDFTVFMRQGQDVDGGFNVFKEQFDWLYRESATTGRFMNIGLHPHVIGQPFRIRALHDFIAYAKEFDDVWFATREEIAEWYLKNHHTPHAVTQRNAGLKNFEVLRGHHLAVIGLLNFLDQSILWSVRFAGQLRSMISDEQSRLHCIGDLRQFDRRRVMPAAKFRGGPRRCCGLHD